MDKNSSQSEFLLTKGLAVYKKGRGNEVFIMPYPHASTIRPVAEGRLAELFISMGFSIISFDPPGFCNSTRKPELTLDEMINCACECLDYFNITKPITLIGHSMGSFCSLALVIRESHRIGSQILVGSVSGWPQVRKYSIHKSFRFYQKQYWLSRYLGTRIILGLDNLEIHKRLDNLNASFSFYNKDLYEAVPLFAIDKKLPPPPRAGWLKSVRNYDLSTKLDSINIPTLLITGLFDRITPPRVAKEIQKSILNSRLEIFKESGHSPFIEEPDRFKEIVSGFLH